MGYAAQRSQFCPVGGLRDVMNNRGSHRLLTYLAVIAIALAVMSFIGLALGSFVTLLSIASGAYLALNIEKRLS
jgi:hypothetical protein